MVLKCASMLALCGLAAAPVLAGPFDAPFTGTVDTEIISMTLTGNVSGYPVTVEKIQGPGQTVIAGGGGGGRIIADSFFDVFFDISIGPLNYTPDSATMRLVPTGHPFPPPDFPPPNLPIPDVDPLPPVGEKYMAAPWLTFAPDFILTAIVHEVGPVTNRVLIPGGEEVTFDSTAVLAVQMIAGNRFGLPGGYPLLLNLAGPTTVRELAVVPEPATLALLGLGGLALLRRKH